jgi:hypothetical protein
LYRGRGRKDAAQQAEADLDHRNAREQRDHAQETEGCRVLQADRSNQLVERGGEHVEERRLEVLRHLRDLRKAMVLGDILHVLDVIGIVPAYAELEVPDIVQTDEQQAEHERPAQPGRIQQPAGPRDRPRSESP